LDVDNREDTSNGNYKPTKTRLLFLCLYNSVRILRFVKTILVFIHNRANETFLFYTIRNSNFVFFCRDESDVNIF